MTPDRFGRRGEVEADVSGWRVRFPGGVPGERAAVRIVHVSKGGKVARAKWLETLGDPHPARREVVCPIHERCGGCGLQRIGASAALDLKVDQARRVLKGAGEWRPAIASPRAYRYRCKTFLLPQRRGAILILGARPPRGEGLVDTSDCAVLREELEALAARARVVLEPRTDLADTLRSVLMRCNRHGKTQLTLVHRGDGQALEEPLRAIAPKAGFLQRHDEPGNRIHSDEPERQVGGEEPIVERIADTLSIAIPPTAFSQGNAEVADRLYRAAAEELSGKSIVELYCGAGTAGLLALTRQKQAKLHGIDKSSRAIELARRNAEHNGLGARCRFEALPAEEASGDWDCVLVNPPRAGCHEAVLETIASSRATRLVYLSCSPATLARDVDRLGWSLAAVQPADMFPQTPHLELLAVLER